MKPIELAEKLNACKEASNFASQFETIKEAWEACLRGDWMLWVAAKLNIDKKLLVGAAGRCAGTVRHLMKDQRSLAAVDACEKFAAGEISIQELRAAATYAAYAADAAAADAAYAAAADAAAYAAAYAAYAAAADAAADATAKNRMETANICRELLTDAVMKAVEELELKGGKK